jgi:Zn-dependent peptidase ImmA (M78 family)
VEAFSYAGGTEDLIEVRANAFAASFLMPREGTIRYLEGVGLLKEGRVERLSPGDIVYAMNYFGVSRPAFLYRPGNLGLLDDEERDRLLRELGDFSVTGVARRLGIPIHEYKGVDLRFRQLVREAWQRGRVTTGRAAGLLEMDIEGFRAEMEALGEEVVEDDEADLPLVEAAAE